MAQRKKMIVIDYNDFSGGLNTKDSPGAIADNQMADSWNCYLIGKDVAQRKGYARYNNSARIDTDNAGAGIFNAPFTAADQIVAVAGNKIGVQGTGTWSDITGSVTVSNTRPTMFAMINDELVGVDGINPAWYYTGSGNAMTLSGTNIPTASKVCEEFHGRLFLADGRKLVWSDYMGNWRNDFPGNNNQYFPGNVSGLKVHGDVNNSGLLIFTGNEVHVAYFDADISTAIGGTGTFRFDVISKNHGCISPYSVQECVMDDGSLIIIWADRDGLKAMLPDFKIVKLTENIQPDWDALNHAYIDMSQGVFYKPMGWYLFVCRSGNSSTNNRVIAFDLRNWCVAGIWDLEISALGVVQSDNQDILVGSDYSGYWNRYHYGHTDNGDTINGYFHTKTVDGGYPHYDKLYRSVTMEYAYFGKYSIDISAFYEHTMDIYSTTHTAASGVTLGTMVLDQDVLGESEQLSIVSEEIRGRGRTVQIKLGNSEPGETFRIHRLMVNAELGQLKLYR